ncbi:leucine-rich repeat domain-containing protein [Sphingobacterium sp. NGMCC 1.201703]|uniref:leucine-rich repeat domain-containing protein n=1 Tax=Sphingobacterium sp. NGMCC 1.201703 TaxID=3388657 RepID=UPI0039FD8BF5
MKNTDFEDFWNDLSQLWKADLSHGLGNDYSLRGKIPVSFEELNKVKLLYLCQHSNLEPLLHLPNLEALFLSGRVNIDYTSLSKCENLKELGLANTDIDNLNWITSLKKLKKLSISKTKIKNIEPLLSLPSLTELNISETDIEDWKPLTSIHKLSKLYTFYCKKPIDLETVSKLKNLTLIDIRGNDIENLNFLSELKKLKCIWDIDCGTNNYDVLKKLPSLNQIGCRKEVFEEIKDWLIDKTMHYNVNGKEITIKK